MGCAAVVSLPLRLLDAFIFVAFTSVALIVPLTVILAPLIAPFTDKLASRPTEVIFGCAAVVSLPVIFVTLNVAAFNVPLTVKLESVPTEVILGWAAVVSAPVTERNALF